MAILQQLRLRRFACFREFAFQQLRDGRAELVILAAVLFRECVDRLRDPRVVELKLGLWREFGRHGVHSIRITDGSSGVISGLSRNVVFDFIGTAGPMIGRPKLVYNILIYR